MGLFEIISIIVLIFCGWLFWQTRVMAEVAKAAIDVHCDKYALQVLTVARTSNKPSRNSKGHFCWRATYQFEFSSDGESYYIGYAKLNGTHVLDIETPAYRQNV